MASQIQLTRSGISGVQPAASELEYGELALNYADGKLFYRDEADNLKAVNDTYQNSNNTIYVNSTNSAEPKIGLNTTSPEFLLDLGGDTGSAYNTLRINQTTGGTAIRIGSDGVGASGEDITLLRVDNADGETTSGADGFSIKYLGSNSDNELAIFTDNGSSQLQALTILQNGNVGIGVAAPDVKLDVAGSAAITNQLLIGDEWDTNTPAGGDKIYIKDTAVASGFDPIGTASDSGNNTTSTKDEFPLLISIDNNDVGNPTSHGILLYNSSGNAGTFAPSILFGSRESSAEAEGQYRAATAGIYCRSPLGVGGATDGHYGDGELIFATSGLLNGSTTANSQGLSQRMVIDRSGNVGIGTTSPVANLQVGDGTSALTFLMLGPNSDTSTSQIIFGDSADQPDPFNAGMGIRYDSLNNQMCFDDNNEGNSGLSPNNAIMILERDTGQLEVVGNAIAADPTADTHLTTKAYVDNSIKHGSTPTYSGNQNITGRTDFSFGMSLQHQGCHTNRQRVYSVDTGSPYPTTFIDVLDVKITPRDVNSGIMIRAMINGEGNSQEENIVYDIHRKIGSSGSFTKLGIRTDADENGLIGTRMVGLVTNTYDNNEDSTMMNVWLQFIDEPQTTEELTYSIGIRSCNSTEYKLNSVNNSKDNPAYERASSNVVLTELAGIGT